MTQHSSLPAIKTLTLSLDDVIAQHGAPRVLLAALLALMHPPPRVRRAPGVAPDALSDHVRRDIGLGPSPPPLPSWRFRP